MTKIYEPKIDELIIAPKRSGLTKEHYEFHDKIGENKFKRTTYCFPDEPSGDFAIECEVVVDYIVKYNLATT